MAEAYKCDRCGSQRDGGPNSELLLTKGRERTRPERFTHEGESFHPGEMVNGVEYDLCAACRNDLKAWWASAQEGERSDLAIKGMDYDQDGDPE